MLKILKMRLTRVFLSSILSCSVLISMALPAAASTEVKVQNNVASTVFGVISDTHLSDSAGATAIETKTETKLKNALEIYKSHNIKLLIVDGDIADQGQAGAYKKFTSVFNSVFTDPTTAPKKVLIMGNHDYYNNLSPADAQKNFMDNIGTSDINTNTTVNGYHFIGLSTEDGPLEGTFTNKSATWLDTQLHDAAQEDPTKPIFVSFHQPVSDTVFESEVGGAGHLSLNDVLSKYPQVVLFTGHTHAPLQDERSIYQKDYTCVNDAEISYCCLDSDTDKANDSDGVPPKAFDVAQGLLVSADSKAITITRMDLVNNKQIKDNWVLPCPLNKSTFTYTDARKDADAAPYFDTGSTVSTNSKSRSCSFTFTSAKDDDFVYSYNIQVKDADSGAAVKSVSNVSDFYLGLDTMAATQTFSVSGLQPGKKYTAAITASDTWGKTSAPITTTFTTQTAPVITIGSYNTAPTNKKITVTATADKGTLNATSHTFTKNGSFTFTAVDSLGNRSSKTVTISNIDRRSPVITVNAYNTRPTNKNITVTATTDKGTLNAVSHTFTRNSTFKFIARDKTGNVTIKAVRISNIDKTAPTVTVKKSGKHVIAACRNYSSRTVRLNGRAIPWPAKSTFTAKGFYLITLKDNAGNSKTAAFIIK